jgi:hypothetical protein
VRFRVGRLLLVEFIPVETMLELFIELTNHLFWVGYAEQLAKEQPAVFQIELAEFMNQYL